MVEPARGVSAGLWLEGNVPSVPVEQQQDTEEAHLCMGEVPPVPLRWRHACRLTKASLSCPERGSPRTFERSQASEQHASELLGWQKPLARSVWTICALKDTAAAGS